MPNGKDLIAQLEVLSDPDRAKGAARFFKTGPGEYGEGDRFRGIAVPTLRSTIRSFRQLPLDDIETVLRSTWHEDRLAALLLFVYRFERGDAEEKQDIYGRYVANFGQINNWDLVDSSAPQIVGGWLADRDRKILRTWAKAPHLWTRRIAVLATLYFIRAGDFADIATLAEMLLEDREDLMHKAVGWMLREVGKRDEGTLEKFLQKHCRRMPRTMLRYAIERMPPDKREQFLRG